MTIDGIIGIIISLAVLNVAAAYALMRMDIKARARRYRQPTEAEIEAALLEYETDQAQAEYLELEAQRGMENGQ